MLETRSAGRSFGELELTLRFIAPLDKPSFSLLHSAELTPPYTLCGPKDDKLHKTSQAYLLSPKVRAQPTRCDRELDIYPHQFARQPTPCLDAVARGQTGDNEMANGE